MTAGTTGYSSNCVGEHQGILTNSLLYDLVNHMYTFPETESPKDKIFDAQSKVIQGNCCQRSLRHCPDAVPIKF